MLWEDSADDKLVIFFSYFSHKIESDTSCRSFFYEKKKEKYFKISADPCLPSMQSVNGLWVFSKYVIYFIKKKVRACLENISNRIFAVAFVVVAVVVDDDDDVVAADDEVVGLVAHHENTPI